MTHDVEHAGTGVGGVDTAPDPESAATTAIPRQPHDFSELAGPLAELDDDTGYRVAYRNLNRAKGRRSLLAAIGVALLGVAFDVAFVLWLLRPDHMPWQDDLGLVLFVDIFLICSIGVIEFFRLLNLVSLALASVLVRDPVPVPPAPGLRVAFVTTIVPSTEPIAMVRKALAAARHIHYSGGIDVWLLDEGDDPEVRRVCAELGVEHFTRKGLPMFNTASGEFKARTKHGNYNAWLDAIGHRYDVMLSVDPDHVPLPCYAERMLGYFRDPDVAFVAGPQTYSNQVSSLVTAGAESQQFPFHGLIQRAANKNRAAMLVGTNNAIRVDALTAVGGLQDSITEDMATGLLLHSRRNPATGRRWDSVYTPDVVALGEGPACWGDYFGQQLRWSRGTLEIIRAILWKRLHRMPAGRMLHYLLLTSFYPSMALSWVLGCLNAVLCLTIGATGLVVPPTVWLALYVDAMVSQVWIFVRNRRYNVSPYEEEGSPGLLGVVMSLLCAPLYAKALLQTAFRRPARFVVTPKSLAASTDHLLTFRTHLAWALVIAGALAVAAVRGNLSLVVLPWPLVAIGICAFPVVNWLVRGRRVVPSPASTVRTAPLPGRPPAPEIVDDAPAGALPIVTRGPAPAAESAPAAGSAPGVEPAAGAGAATSAASAGWFTPPAAPHGSAEATVAVRARPAGRSSATVDPDIATRSS